MRCIYAVSRVLEYRHYRATSVMLCRLSDYYVILSIMSICGVLQKALRDGGGGEVMETSEYNIRGEDLLLKKLGQTNGDRAVVYIM